VSENQINIEAAVAYASDEPLRIEKLSLKAPAKNEILVRIVASGICHTDIMTKNKGLCAFPIVLGHEGVGVIAELGSDVHGFEVGDHVVLSFDYCGHCPQCEIGKPSYCNDHGSLNFAGTRPNGEKTHIREGTGAEEISGSFFQQSSFATFALSHASNTIKVDKDLPLPTLAPLGCGVQTGAGTVFNTLALEAGTSIAIFGCGCVGLSAVMAAKVAGAKNIIAIDINRNRTVMAKELGATHIIQSGKFEASADLVEEIKSISGAGGCHYAIDTSGIPAVLRQAFDCCRPMGVTAMIAPGVPGTEVSVEMLGLLPGKSLRGVVQGDARSKEFIPKLIELWKSGQFPFDRIISFFESIDSVEAAITAMSNGTVIKPVVIFDERFK